ncbi:hypothetical protein [Colwellia psychrerythraea]|uniref:Uncharacterized protein n=1 Tax=Colwellia psychrerythraea TaxID=28229 RepID=A0A099L1U2_COLPS|nr:hypothetical protein [Colwellia psychrerythraea]KGJ96415.1 hypothetical protein GAB14E_0362 [Colwellia psychrerythraea]
MNKTTMLTAGLIVGVAVAFSYSFLGDDVESAKAQQQVISESVQVKAPPSSPSNVTKAVIVTGEKNSEQETVVVDENSFVRAAPPPPIRSNKARDGSYTTPQAHGHEEVSGEHKENAPPPPTGAN